MKEKALLPGKLAREVIFLLSSPLCSITEQELSPLRAQLEELDTRIKEQVPSYMCGKRLYSTVYISGDFGGQALLLCLDCQ